MPFDIAFVTPWILAFLATLPLLWWLLRLTPPSPKKVRFPALMLLRGLASSEKTPARTPWWLLLLRLVIAALLILALARPLINPQATVPVSGALLIAVDNDWAAARNWDARQEVLRRLIDQAEREKRDVALLPTAPLANGEPMQVVGPLPADAIRSAVSRLAPEPWPADWLQAKSLLPKLDNVHVAQVEWLASGLGGGEARTFHEALKQYGDLDTLSDLDEKPIYLLAPPAAEGENPAVAVMRAVGGAAADVSVVGIGRDGHVLAREKVSFPADKVRAEAPVDVPLDIRNQIARFEVEGHRSAAMTALLDESWQRRSVGLAGDQTELAEHSLLSGLYYIDRALKPFADIHVGALPRLLEMKPAVIAVTDAAEINDEDLTRLASWIKRGGIFVRFAGDKLAATHREAELNLLPVSLRTGDRAMGGVLSWAKPQSLRPFPDASPFHGLDIPADVKVSRQILAEPESDLSQKTWAALEDGTPLVTARPLGQGMSILFHVPARSEWSNLPLSGLFVDMLRRIVALSRGTAGSPDQKMLPPLQVLNGLGEEQLPPPAVQPLDTSAHVPVGPQHPPGYYGSEGMRRAFNLGSILTQPAGLSDMPVRSYLQDKAETELAPWLMLAAFILLLADFMISLLLRGLFAPVHHAERIAR